MCLRGLTKVSSQKTLLLKVILLPIPGISNHPLIKIPTFADSDSPYYLSIKNLYICNLPVLLISSPGLARKIFRSSVFNSFRAVILKIKSCYHKLFKATVQFLWKTHIYIKLAAENLKFRLKSYNGWIFRNKFYLLYFHALFLCFNEIMPWVDKNS